MGKKNIISSIMLIIGIVLVLYPFILNYITEKDQANVIADYQSEVNILTQSQKNEKIKNGEKYNSELSEDIHVDVSLDKTEENIDYINVLDIGDIMGYISIPKIKVELPIYHGTSDNILKNGVGHLESSSLPIGGKNTHCVLAGHTGLASGKIFDNIDKLEFRDIFVIKVLDKTLEYKVVNIVKVDPNDTEAIKLDPEKDYVTLVTCTPRLINTHRLLVRGERVQDEKSNITNEEFEKIEPSSQKVITTEENNLKTIIKGDKKIYIILGSILILIVIFIWSHIFIKNH